MSTRILTRAKFKAWLESKPKRSVVGFSGRASSCPMASYIKSRNDSATVYVNSSEIIIGLPQERRVVSLPQNGWISQFVMGVDGSGLSNITAARALKILEGCK